MHTHEMNENKNSPPRDTNARSQRASRPVPFDSHGDLWAAVNEGVIFSSDLDARFQFNPPPMSAFSPRTPSPARVLLPYQRQLPPVSAPPGGGGGRPPVRAPLGEADLNVLGAELKALESENAALKKQVDLQDRLIVGFCGLVGHERENRRPE